jgi:hypothetical protein
MNRRTLVDAFGKWLNEFDWAWFITLTFRKPQSAQTANHAFLGFMDRLKKKLNYFRVIEDADKPSLLHIHALIGSGDIVSPDKLIEDEWKRRHGKAKAQRYDKTKGAAYYINKHINSDKMDWDFRMKKAKEQAKPEETNITTLLQDL